MKWLYDDTSCEFVTSRFYNFGKLVSRRNPQYGGEKFHSLVVGVVLVRMVVPLMGALAVL